MELTIIVAIIAFLAVTLLLVGLLLFAKAKLTSSGEVTIDINGGEKVITTESGSTLLATLANNKVFLPSACGGGGSCGMCKCQVIEGGGDILPTETGFITRKMAKEHWRLGCQVKVKENLKIQVPEALMHYMDNQSRSVLIGERIFNETELACRLEVELEKYTMKVQIESRVLGDLAINHIVPTAVIYQNRLLENLRGLRETFSPEEYEVLSADRKELVREISKRVTAIKVQVREMTEARKVANHMDNYKDKAFAYEETVRPYLESIRDHIDHLEMEIDDEIWPLPKYRELLFTK